jgi:hemerythrin-like domain-containing protein
LGPSRGRETIEEDEIMQATDILREEHRTIELVLNALEGMANLITEQNQLDAVDAGKAIDFIRSFADKYHHAKEEDLLFVEMESIGFSREAGPIAVMLYDHETGRNHVRQMAEAREAHIKNAEAAATKFARHASQFAALLRGHIQKEDNILYPMADEALSDANQSALLEGFARADKANGGEAAKQHYASVAKELFDAYAKHSPALVAGAGACGVGCWAGGDGGHGCERGE